MYRTALRSELDFSVRGCFEAIDVERKNFLDSISISNFLRYLGKPLSENEIISFI